MSESKQKQRIKDANTVISQVQKMLRLARDTATTEEVATNIVEKASNLLLKYNLSLEDVERKTEKENIAYEIVEIALKEEMLCKTMLLQAIASNNFCQSFYAKYELGCKMLVFGSTVNRAVVISMYEYLKDFVWKRSYDEAGKYRVACRSLGLMGNVYVFQDSFRKGCIQRIWHRLEERKKKQEREGIEKESNQEDNVGDNENDTTINSGDNEQNNQQTALAVRTAHENEQERIRKFLQENGVNANGEDIDLDIKNLPAYYEGWLVGEEVSLDRQILGASNPQS